MKLRYKYRCYPTQSQQEALVKCFGVSRFVYNWGLHLRTSEYQNNKKIINYNKSSAMMTELKRQEDYAWLNEVSFDVIQQSLRDLQASFKNFFNKTARYPKFKCKGRAGDSAKFTRNSMWVEESHVRLTKVGRIKVEFHRDLPSKPLSCTIIRNKAGQYYASFVVEVERENITKTNKSIGIDVGISTFATLSNGKKIANPKFLSKSIKKVKRLNHQISKKRKDSNRRKRAKLKLAKAHQKVVNQRKDFLNKESLKIIKEFDNIHIEDLDLISMGKNQVRDINRSISDTSIGTFFRLLQGKAEMYGKSVEKINRFYPSSQICSNCGYRNQELKLTHREWECKKCSTIHDRDINAAKNILAVGHTAVAH